MHKSMLDGFIQKKIQSLKIIGSKKTIVFDDILKTIKVVEIKIDKDQII